jgi:carbonic anhydrase
MTKFCAACVAVLSLCFASHAASPAGEEKLTRMLQQSTLTLLKEGNLRFAEGKPLHPNLEANRRTDLATNGQEPMATILACSDSRDPVELIFDRGIGDLFVVRVAGNVAGLSELATIEYGVTHLGTTVLVVMGHSQCGAVTAAVKGAELHGHLPSLISLIKPAAEKARTHATEAELVPRSIELNVWQQIENVFARSALIRESAAAGKVQIVGAVYDISSGKVQWLGSHPELNRLLADAKATATPPGSHAAADSHDSHVATSATPTASAPAHSTLLVPAEPTKTDSAKHTATRPVEALKSVHDLQPAKPITRAEVANSHH